MRLWHKDIIEFLAKGQLVSQWRELNSIYAKQDKHILINYVYDYEPSVLFNYSMLVIKEMEKRGYRINKWDNFIKYFNLCELQSFSYDSIISCMTDKHKDWNYCDMFKEHNDRYLLQCFYNLQEKYDRGQSDFSKAEYDCLLQLVSKKGLYNEDK